MKPEAAALTVKETARLFGFSAITVRRMIQRGELPSLRVGSRVLVPKAALIRQFGSDIFPAPIAAAR